MPRGAKPGERRGGRTKGTPNRTTVERRLKAERELADAKASGKKLAKDVLDDFMQLFAERAAFYQPALLGGKPNANADEQKFVEYALLAIECAKELARYQSPTFRAIAVTAPADEQPSLAAAGPEIVTGDPTEIARVYRELGFHGRLRSRHCRLLPRLFARATAL